MASLAEAYYNILEATHKELIWLKGGHRLNDKSLPQFIDIIVNQVLPQNSHKASIQAQDERYS